VHRGGQALFLEVPPDPDRGPVLTAAQLGDLSYALSLNSAQPSPAAGRPGSWSPGPRLDETTDAWMVGFSTNLAVAVWLGSPAGARPLVDRAGDPVYGSGLPKAVFTNFFADLNRPGGSLPGPTMGGRVDPPLSVAG
jgi:membrane peptidoglycan carboxypeptidase